MGKEQETNVLILLAIALLFLFGGGYKIVLYKPIISVVLVFIAIVIINTPGE